MSSCTCCFVETALSHVRSFAHQAMDLVWSVPVLSGSPGVSHGLPFKNGFRRYAEDLIWDLVPMQIMASILAGQGRVWSSEGRNLHADTPSSYSQDLQHQKDTWRSWRATAAQCWTQWPTGHSSVEASSPPQVLLHCSCFLEAWMQLCHYRGGGGAGVDRTALVKGPTSSHGVEDVGSL